MSKYVVVVLILLLLVGCKTIPSNAPYFAEAPAPGEGQALVYMYRLDAAPTKRTPDVLLNGEFLFEPPEGAYTWFYLPVGDYLVEVDWAPDIPQDTSALLVAEAGLTYYVKIVGQQLGGAVWETHVVGVDPRYAMKEMEVKTRYIPPSSNFVIKPNSIKKEVI